MKIAPFLVGIALAASSVPASASFVVDPNPDNKPALNLTNGSNQKTDVATVTINSVSQTVNITTDVNSSFASGNATIKPENRLTLTDILFTPVDDTAFNTFSFRGQMVDAGDITIKVIDAQGNLFTFTDTIAKANQDFDRFGVHSIDGETIKSIELISDGFKEAKQFAMDFVSIASPVPEPSTWAMMLIGFAGLGFAGYKQARRRAIAA